MCRGTKRFTHPLVQLLLTVQFTIFLFISQNTLGKWIRILPIQIRVQIYTRVSLTNFDRLSKLVNTLWSEKGELIRNITPTFQELSIRLCLQLGDPNESFYNFCRDIIRDFVVGFSNFAILCFTHIFNSKIYHCIEREKWKRKV